MAEVLHQSKIGVRIRSSRCAWHDMMGLEFFPIEEAVPTDRAQVLLSLGNASFTGRKFVRFGTAPRCPIGPQRWIIRRGGAAHDHLSFDLDPFELQEGGADRFVPKDPVVRPMWVKPSPLAVSPPGIRFVRAPPIHPADGFEDHPGVQGTEDFGSDGAAEVVGPAPHDGSERT